MRDYLTIRYDYKTNDVQTLFDMPFMELLDTARAVHKQYHPENEIQLASLLSIKTGYCAENCSYCPQSAHWAKKTGLAKSELMDTSEVLQKAQTAKDAGASRFCMGAAWRDVRDGQDFDKVLDMVRGVKKLGMEACVTLGMLNEDQAKRLAEAGVTAYNHNIDTSPEYYDKIITTRTFEDRIQTLDNVRKAGMSVCCGGIIGMGEGIKDRAEMLKILSNMTPHPESVPINALVAAKGTPLEGQAKIEPLEFIRTIAVARIIMPKTRVRLSAGRKEFSQEMQVMAFYAGANSIFYGEKLLTTDNNDAAEDLSMIKAAGLRVQGIDMVQ
jgi:biotin synthase